MAKSRGREPAQDPLVDHGRDAVGLGRDGVVVDVADGRAVLPRRAQSLVDPGDGLEPVRVVVADEPRRHVEDHLRGAIVVDEHDLAGARVEAAEGEQVRGGGAAPAVDGLVVVAHDRDVGPVPRHQLQHLELGVVRVLELVDDDEAVALAQAGEHGGALAQQRERAVDLVAEVDEPGLGEQALVRLVEGGELEVRLGLVPLLVGRRRGEPRLGPRAVLRRRDVLVLGAAHERRERGEVTRGVAERAEAVEREAEEALAQEDHLLRLREDTELGVEPASSADSRSTRSPNAWNVEIVVSA